MKTANNQAMKGVIGVVGTAGILWLAVEFPIWFAIPMALILIAALWTTISK